MSKKIKFLIILIIIIIAIGLFFGIASIVKFIKFQNIYSKISSNIEFDNYYLKTTSTINNGTNVTEAFYKQGTGKLVAENGVYTWTDGENAYMVDEENKKVYTLDIDNYKGLVSYEMFASLVPGYTKNIFGRFVLAGNIRTTIKTEKDEDNKYIVIKYTENKVTKTIWLEDKTKKPVKANMEFSDGTIYEYEYELKFNSTKLSDIELPDLTEYTTVDNTSQNENTDETENATQTENINQAENIENTAE